MIELVGNQNLKLDIVARMRIYGGSFVKALAECIMRADPNNLKKLQDSFQEYLHKYHIDNWEGRTKNG